MSRAERQDRDGADSAWRSRAAAVADPALPAERLPRSLMLEVFQHARECYPEECCGLLIGPSDPSLPNRFVRCTNVQSTRRAQGDSELDARHAFWIDEKELLEALVAAEGRGEALRVVYHSHVDAPAYLSHTDLQGALGPDGHPLWPGVAYLVVSVSEDGVGGAALFSWSVETGRFMGRAVQETG